MKQTARKTASNDEKNRHIVQVKQHQILLGTSPGMGENKTL